MSVTLLKQKALNLLKHIGLRLFLYVFGPLLLLHKYHDTLSHRHNFIC